MAKKLSDIKSLIEENNILFLDYLNANLKVSILNFIKKIGKKTDIYIFSGIIRNFFLGEKDIRDIDIILKDKIELSHVLSKYEPHKNSFGGYKIIIDNISLDLWYLEDTWMFQYEKIFNFCIEHSIPNTAFFNFSSIMYSISEKKFYYNDSFVRFLRDKKIDVVNKVNPNYPLCIINSLYYSEKYNLPLSKNLKDFIKLIYKRNYTNYSRIQIKHFGKIIYSDEDIAQKILSL